MRKRTAMRIKGRHLTSEHKALLLDVYLGQVLGEPVTNNKEPWAVDFSWAEGLIVQAENRALLIDDEQDKRKGAGKAHKIPENFTLSEDTTRLLLHRITQEGLRPDSLTKDLTNAVVSDFIYYWRGRGTPRKNWNASFIRYLNSPAFSYSIKRVREALVDRRRNIDIV